MAASADIGSQQPGAEPLPLGTGRLRQFVAYARKVLGLPFEHNPLSVFRNFEAYDPARDRWYFLPPMTVPRHGFAGGIIGNRFHAVSGQLQSGTCGGGPGSTEAHEAFEVPRLWDRQRRALRESLRADHDSGQHALLGSRDAH